MRRALLVAVGVLLVLGACSGVIDPDLPSDLPPGAEGPAYGSLTVDIAVAGVDISLAAQSTNPIEPSEEPVVTSIEISGRGPESSTFQETYTQLDVSGALSLTKDSLLAGPWTVTVSGRTGSGTELAVGSFQGTVPAGGHAVFSVSVTPPDDNGTLRLQVSWPPEIDYVPVLDGVLFLGNDELPFTLSQSGTGGVYENGDVPVGMYYVAVYVWEPGEDGRKIHRHTEGVTVKIRRGVATQVQFPVNAEDLNREAALPPTVTVKDGPTDETRRVEIRTETLGDDVAIRFTRDGSVPSETVGELYTGPITVTSTQTIRAVAYSQNHPPSTVEAQEIDLPGTVAVPEPQAPGGVHVDPIPLEFADLPSGVAVLYTTDGTDPDPSDPSSGIAYAGPVTIDATSEIRAVAYDENDPTRRSDIIVTKYWITGEVAAPSFSLSGGTFATERSLELSTTTDDASIYYTTNGSVPTKQTGTLYDGAIPVDRSMTVRAVAVKPDWADSPIVWEDYELVVGEPTVSPAGGTYDAAQTVILETQTPGAVIRYTTDGTAPTAGEPPVYADPISLNADTTIRAIAARDGWSSSPAISESYVFRPQAPTFDPPAGHYMGSSLDVSIDSGTPGTELRYTTDGSDPGGHQGVPGNRVSVTSEVELKAVALRSGWNPSPMTVGTYVLEAVPSEPVPGDNGVVNDTRPQLRWTPIQDAAEYRVELEDQTGTVIEADVVTDAAYTPESSLTDGASYSWRVKAVHQDGTETAWSDTWQMAVDVTATIEFDDRIDEGFTVTLSADDETVELGGAVTLTAASGRPADEVTWYVDGAIKPEWRNQTSVSFTPPLAGVYAVSVVVRSGAGLASDTVSITVTEGEALAPGGLTIGDAGGAG